MLHTVRPEDAAEKTWLTGLASNLAEIIRKWSYVNPNRNSPEWGRLVLVRLKGVPGEAMEIGDVVAAPNRITERGERVRVRIDNLDDLLPLSKIINLVRMELEPIIIGLGKVVVRETKEGCIVFSADEWDGFNSHGLVSCTDSSRRNETPTASAPGLEDDDPESLPLTLPRYLVTPANPVCLGLGGENGLAIAMYLHRGVELETLRRLAECCDRPAVIERGLESLASGTPCEVTPAMIEAGIAAKLDFDRRFDSDETLVENVYRAMAALSSRVHGKVAN